MSCHTQRPQRSSAFQRLIFGGWVEEETAILDFAGSSPTYAVDDGVITRAIKLRQRQRMKLGDAIIAATALEYDIPLLTRNESDFKHIAGLDLLNPFAASP